MSDLLLVLVMVALVIGAAEAVRLTCRRMLAQPPVVRPAALRVVEPAQTPQTEAAAA